MPSTIPFPLHFSRRDFGAIALCIALAGLSAPAATAQIAVRSSLAHDQEATPGTTYQGTVKLENLTGEPQEARLKLRDYRFSRDGTNEFPEPGTQNRSNADWISVPQSVVTVPPQGMRVVEYEVQVPEQIGGTPPRGTYWSVLLVEPIGPKASAPALSPSDEESQFGVRQTTRYGVQIATHLRSTQASNLEVINTDLVRRGGMPHLVVDLKNTGVEMARPEVELEAYDDTGTVALREEADAMRVYPRTSVRYRLPLSELDSGSHEALVLVDAGGKHVTGFQYSVEL